MRPKGCLYGKANCIVEDGNCDKIGVVYRITCKSCLSVIEENCDTHNYVGLTRTTVHNRMEQHLKAQHQKLSSSAMYRHDCDVHNSVPQSYTTKVIAREKRIVRLYCTEALHIEKQDRVLSINAKMEGGRSNSGVVRIRATREHM